MRSQLTPFNVRPLMQHLRAMSRRGRVRITPYQTPGSANKAQTGTLSVEYYRADNRRSLLFNLSGGAEFSVEVEPAGHKPTRDMDSVSWYELGRDTVCIWTYLVGYGEAWLHFEVVR